LPPPDGPKTSVISWAWIAALSYIVTGGLIARVGHFIGAVGGYCAEPTDELNAADPIYRTCDPCTLYFSVFGVIEVSACPDPIIAFVLNAFVAIPHVAIVILSMVLYALPWLLRWAVLLACIIAFVYVVAKESGQKRPAAALHRGLIIALLGLGAIHALML